ncbi:MAG TPA: hypothetical protein VK400_13345 [Pyrinomonadaceae bacterium]|nr:hypothetical protein [Pyrinomonadaceae bacterium]
MKNLRFLAITGIVACCMVIFGSQSNTNAQGRSGKSRGNSSIGKTRSTDVIQRGIERMTSNRSQRTQNRNRDWYNDRRISNSRNRRNNIRTNNGVRDWGRGIGRGKGQGKGRGYAKRANRNRNY